jgi:3-methylfumaryl-CoA hydratase
VLRVSEKQGTTGRILLVTVRHEVNGDDGLAISEEQDILYLGAQATAVKSAPPAAPTPASAFTRPFVPDPVMLFRFSALTGNSHRIHYDERYARSVERYPALVVHGPLQAICLADLLRRHEPDAQLARFEFRSQRAALLGQALVLGRMVRRRGGLRACTCAAARGGSVCMQAQATLGQLDT